MYNEWANTCHDRAPCIIPPSFPCVCSLACLLGHGAELTPTASRQTCPTIIKLNVHTQPNIRHMTDTSTPEVATKHTREEVEKSAIDVDISRNISANAANLNSPASDGKAQAPALPTSTSSRSPRGQGKARDAAGAGESNLGRRHSGTDKTTRSRGPADGSTVTPRNLEPEDLYQLQELIGTGRYVRRLMSRT
jgi:hypothetical protein